MDSVFTEKLVRDFVLYEKEALLNPKWVPFARKTPGNPHQMRLRSTREAFGFVSYLRDGRPRAPVASCPVHPGSEAFRAW